MCQIHFQLDHWEKMLPIETMTMEEFGEHFPDKQWHQDRPTWFPHNEFALTPESEARRVQEQQ